jgi:glutamate synthase (NADPH/NADH) large chain
MTGGRVVVLGPTGRNFGAGMSGGIAYVWNREGNFEKQCNTGTFELEEINSEADAIELKSMIEKHLKYTGSAVAEKILKEWSTEIGYFVKVMPSDYKRVLEGLSTRGKMRA